MPCTLSNPVTVALSCPGLDEFFADAAKTIGVGVGVGERSLRQHVLRGRLPMPFRYNGVFVRWTDEELAKAGIVRQTPEKVVVPDEPPLDLVLSQELADLLGVPRQQVSLMVKKGIIPKPLRLAERNSMAWRREDVAGIVSRVREHRREVGALVSTRELCELFSIHRRTLARWVEVGTLPQPIRLSPCVLRWRREVVLALIAKRDAGRIGYTTDAEPDPA